MKYYIIAGEASGDLHGSNLMKQLLEQDPEAEFRFWGGDLMAAVGGELIKHYRDLAFMGFLEVAKNIRTILRNIRFCKEDIEAYAPDALILVDYPGFNLRIAKWAKKAGIRVFYYISPQIWAWHSSRVHGIKASVDKMFVILPFEPDFYRTYDYPVDFVGHPLLDVTENYQVKADFYAKNELPDKPLIALFPGSRKQEITRMLSEMLKVVPHYPDYHFVIAGAPSQTPAFYHPFLQQVSADNLSFISQQSYDLLSHAQAALVTSGTATLETALFKVPQVVCYKGGPINYWLAKRLINVKYISLVNLIVDRPLVKELIQGKLNTKLLRQGLEELLSPAKVKEIKSGYEELILKLGKKGASERAARLMVSYTQEKQA
ncbi:MAG: lipid-A-disaccharide synthase [Saprospiraceae bacterium]|nr:lipid-A-disaccharide synthase [Saprospiraceae bacterium]